MIRFFSSWMNRYFSDPQVIILGFLLFLAGIMVYMMWNMLTPVFISIVIAYLLEGVVTRLEQLKMPRMPAAVMTFVLFMACFVISLISLLPLLSEQIGDLLQVLPSMIEKGENVLKDLPSRYPAFISEQQLREIADSLSGELTGLVKSKLTNLVRSVFSFSLASVRSIITVLVYSILVPLMIFFFLKDKQIILEWIISFLPEERGLASEVWHEVNSETGNYVRGKIWEILIIWGVTYVTFKLIGLDFTALLSLFVGLSVIVPYIGATVMFLPVALIAYFQWGWGSEFATTMIALAIIQALDGNLLVPLLLSGVVNLHPISIIVAILIFGGVWGIWGLFFAIPLATLVHALMKAMLTKYKGERYFGIA
ncbi:MAG: AI-2E family transporter [Desulfobacteraceae bacterium 4572_88]|nr:MAG: AI-2E family transporter [Desulfobacteraceae bacterium 4572_88]